MVKSKGLTRGKFQLTLGLIFSFIASVQSQDLQLELKSCSKNSPIDNAYVINESNGRVLGYSNKQGRVIVFTEKIEWPLKLKVYKMSALDTSIVLARGVTSICMNPRSQQLSAFEVVSEKENTADSFRQFLNKTIAVLKKADTTHFYSFTWKYELPDSNWSMNIEGLIKMPFQSYAKAYSGGYAGKFCQVVFTVEPDFYESKYLKDVNLNQIGSYFTNYDFVRKKSPYRKRITDEMVLKKVRDPDSTRFIYSSPLKNDWKLYIGYPVFDKDSILLRNVSEFQLLDTIGKQKENFIYLEEFCKQEYALVGGSLVLSSIELDAALRYKSGAVSRVLFRATLISDSTLHCSEKSIMTGFRRKDLDEFKKVDGYQVIVQ